MKRFYCTVETLEHSSITGRGSNRRALVTAESRTSGIEVIVYADGPNDVFKVYKTNGTGDSERKRTLIHTHIGE